MTRELLKMALDMRIPKVTDKDLAIEVLQGHVSSGMLTKEDAQGYVDMMYPILYDEEGNALNEQTIVEFAEADPYLSIQEQLDILTLTVLEMKGEI